MSRYLPILAWAPRYDRNVLANDLVAAVIVTIMLIPQSLAYALLAGLPPEIGLYASILPLVAYALFGTSRTLAVGPVAVASLMTAAAVGKLAATGTPDYLAAAIALAFLSGAFLVALGLLRLGFLANFLSHPVIAGFITASGVIIAASQLKHILGVKAGGENLFEIVLSLAGALPQTSPATVAVGLTALAFLFWVRRGLKPVLLRAGLRPRLADLLTKAGPVAAVAATSLAAWAFGLAEAGVRIVGEVPRGLPAPTLPPFDLDLWLELAGSAALVSIIGFVESVSVAHTLAAKRRQRIDPDQELIALGAANLASGISGGYPVTGGFARSVVNFDAGAETPAAGAFTAVGIAVATLFLTPALYFLPQATLAATIIVAVLSLVDFSVLRRTWRYSKADFAAVSATIVATLLIGVEIGVTAGVLLSVLLYLYRSSRPHMAVVGLVPGTEHFRNVDRHKVATDARVLSLRVDESLYFANARYLEDRIYDLVAERPALEHVVLMCTAVNEIDASALESLEAVNARLKDLGVTLHLSEVKGPVMDRLQRSHFLQDLTGRVFLSQYAAIAALDPGTARLARAAPDGLPPDSSGGSQAPSTALAVL
ncbi:SulP family inorganic anion transporter [Propylenella binzhouense]|uniref:Sulfate permease n=1 Tax=Propylenella binzhouense TaxID=2555902 RepID=A0A964T6A7_9HYPH|nr:sulfate permease [Propylenella binzhouense]MYZ49273.1 sulfate permease [Propylenella binzhouense]